MKIGDKVSNFISLYRPHSQTLKNFELRKYSSQKPFSGRGN